jgi:3-phenylpropionate/trans-cinnamate dioxygenase ferredoxin reductase subunit
MNASPSFVIVGASLAGATAAQTLREEGFSGRVELIGDEAEPPYERPPLSKAYLQGNSPREKVFVHPADWYRQNDVNLRLGTTVVAVDRAARRVSLADGDALPYDALLLSTGSAPRRLQVPGIHVTGVHYLRSLADSDRIKQAFLRSPRVVVIGGGWIGLETAAAARTAGLPVTILERGELPLLHVLGREVAQVFADLHRERGVVLRCHAEVAAVESEHGSVTGVRLGDGTLVPADLVLVGVGITPTTRLAADAGLDVGNGISVDAHLRTADPAVFAAGDVADAYTPHLGRHVRVEHWANARRQGDAAARSMLGQDISYDRPPYFFTDQYDLGMEYTGHVDPDRDHRVVFRGDLERREFLAFWLSEGQVLAGMNVNVWDVTEGIEALISSRRHLDPHRLADPNVALGDV